MEERFLKRIFDIHFLFRRDELEKCSSNYIIHIIYIYYIIYIEWRFYGHPQRPNWPLLDIYSESGDKTLSESGFSWKKNFLIDTLLLIPNIDPKVLNSVVKGDLKAFEVQLSYIGPLYIIYRLYKTRKIYLVESGTIFYRDSRFESTYAHNHFKCNFKFSDVISDEMRIQFESNNSAVRQLGITQPPKITILLQIQILNRIQNQS